jgi:hypothetical protein
MYVKFMLTYLLVLIENSFARTRRNAACMVGVGARHARIAPHYYKGLLLQYRLHSRRYTTHARSPIGRRTTTLTHTRKHALTHSLTDSLSLTHARRHAGRHAPHTHTHTVTRAMSGGFGKELTIGWLAVCARAFVVSPRALLLGLVAGGGVWRRQVVVVSFWREKNTQPNSNTEHSKKSGASDFVRACVRERASALVVLL